MLGVWFGVVLFVGALSFPVGMLFYLTLWGPIVARLPSRDALTMFVVTSLRDEPEQWRGGNYSMAHNSGLALEIGYERVTITRPKELKLPKRRAHRVIRAAGRWRRRVQAVEDKRARVAAIETIVGQRVS